jgi:hypothetical protein
MKNNIELEVLPCHSEAMLKDLVLLLLKKEIITVDELNACQKECSKTRINYMNAKEK